MKNTIRILMKKYLFTITVMAITVMVFTTCARKTSTTESARDSEISILGEWYYVVSTDKTSGSTYEEEKLFYFPELSISTNYEGESSVGIAYAGFDVIYGDMNKINDYEYRFTANPMQELDPVHDSEMIFTYDPAAGRLGWEDHYMTRYYERERRAAAAETTVDSFNFFVAYIHHVDMIQLAQEREIIYYETYGHWDTSGKERIIIYSDVDLHSFKIFTIGANFLEGGDLNYSQEILYSSFALEYATYIPEGIPVEAVYFYTDDGEEHIYLLSYSGIDGRVAAIEQEVSAYTSFSTATGGEFYIYGPWRLEIDKDGNPYTYDPDGDPEPYLSLFIDDPSVIASAYETSINGHLNVIDEYNYQFRVYTRSVMWTTETVDEIIPLEYNPDTGLLRYEDRGEVLYFRKGSWQ